jgi:hypothetical protein
MHAGTEGRAKEERSTAPVPSAHACTCSARDAFKGSGSGGGVARCASLRILLKKGCAADKKAGCGGTLG